MECITKDIEEENTQKISLEKSVLAETKKEDIARCQSTLCNVLGKEEIEQLGSDSEEDSINGIFWIDFKIFRNVKFAQSFKNLKFFDINFLAFDHVDSKNRYLANFLESLFPNKTNWLYFKCRNKINLKRSNYLNSLTRLSSKVAQIVTFQRFRIGLPQLKRLVVAYKHVRVLRLFDCRLSIPIVPDLSKALTNCQIQELDLEGSGRSGNSDWENNFNQFNNLVQGLASSQDLRLSLKEVDMEYCGVDQDEAEQIFEENQLGKVKIIGGN
ncbi:unnamed protein product [Moneuplotes crassus]|uniref:Uncharacterized protein n=1 Tax=Euplotes crassus TaxID=5936 RepID=A0AAD1XD22_EUPCR|nr:unnamed protein product [Moneuplotes crassus]